MTSYQGPERRTVITFTREDSDRLVRLEEKLTTTGEKLDTIIANATSSVTKTDKKIEVHDNRINKLETRQSWMLGIGSAIAFLISSAIFWISGHTK